MKPVNLLPPELRGNAPRKAVSGVTSPAEPAAGGAGPYMVLVALGVAVIAMAGYVLAGNSVKDRKAELAEVKAQQVAASSRVAALKPYADFQTLAVSRVATVQALAGSRFDWEQVLRDLSRALPSNVHLTGLSGSVGTDTGAGGQIRSAITAPAISLQGCTKTHSDVARLMSSLRTVRGVTRVSLAKSDKESNGGTAAPAAGVDGGTPAQTCPKGAPPSFDLVVFFERSTAVPTNGPVAPGAVPTGTTGPTGPAGAAAPAPGAPTASSGQPSTANVSATGATP
jgi:Tfp pilus assembly protein PilN